MHTVGPQLEHGGETDIVIFVQFLSGAYGAIVILFLLRLLAECRTPPPFKEAFGELLFD